MVDTFHSPLLDALDWLEHGFGTRQSPPPEEPLATVKQVHSAVVLHASAPGVLGEADALVTATPGLAVAVKTADCVPVLLADPVQRVVAAVHAGWRGTAQEIVARAIESLLACYLSKPGDIVAAIGPGIGKCCFEVGPEVARQFAKWNPALSTCASKTTLDLNGIIRAQLRAAGLFEDHISGLDVCTMHHTDRFYSFRKEREAAGRMFSWIRIHRQKIDA